MDDLVKRLSKATLTDAPSDAEIIRELERLTAERDALVEERDDANAAKEGYFAERNSARDAWRRVSKEIDAANAVIDELRTDAERFKFVQENSEWRRYEGDEQDAPYSMLCVRLPYDADLSCKAMRVAAIDAARALRKGTT